MSKRRYNDVFPVTYSSPERQGMVYLTMLPASLLALVSGFLSLRATVCVIRRLSRHFSASISPAFLSHAFLSITRRSLPHLLASPLHTQQLLSSLPALSIITTYKDEEDERIQIGGDKLSTLLSMRSVSLSNQLLFHSLVSLYIGDPHPPIVFSPGPPSWRSTVDCFLTLLRSEQTAFPSLARLHLQFGYGGGLQELDFSPFSCLRHLNHLRIDRLALTPASTISLLSSLTALPCLTFLDLLTVGIADVRAATVVFTTLSSRLRHLIMPALQRWWKQDEARVATESFCCDSSFSQLEYLLGANWFHLSSSTLISFFTLQRLRVLDLRQCVISLKDLAACCIGFCASGLQSQITTCYLPKTDLPAPGDTAADEMLAIVHLPQLLACFTKLRDLHVWFNDANGRILQSILRSSCVSKLHRLSLSSQSIFSNCIAASSPLSSLTEMALCNISLPVTQMLLMSGIPTLLHLSLASDVSNTSSTILLIAKYCPQLLHLELKSMSMEQLGKTPSCVPSPFFPNLISLAVEDLSESPGYDFAELALFTEPPHASLQQLRLTGLGLTISHIVSLSSLSCLRLLRLRRHEEEVDIKEVLQARKQTQEVLLAELKSNHGDITYSETRNSAEDCEGNCLPSPLGPDQYEEMQRSILKELYCSVEAYRAENVLATVAGAGPEVVRGVFFHCLQSLRGS